MRDRNPKQNGGLNLLGIVTNGDDDDAKQQFRCHQSIAGEKEDVNEG